jgi:hypothetical protein
MKKSIYNWVVTFFYPNNKHKSIVACNYSMFIINTMSLDSTMATKIYAWNECGDEVHINGN